jgi:hypothetical protein
MEILFGNILFYQNTVLINLVRIADIFTFFCPEGIPILQAFFIDLALMQRGIFVA